MKTIKVSDETHRRLVKVMGTLQAKEGKKKKVEDALLFLLDGYETEIENQFSEET